MNKNLVSLIVPIWNVEKYVVRCIESIINQTYNKIEIIVINDCSTDNSIKLIEPLLCKSGRKFRIIHHSENQGLGAARLTGLNNALGEYILNIDSDDWIDKDYVSDLMRIANQDDSDIVISDYYISYLKNEQYRQQQVNCKSGKELAKQILSGELQGFLWNKLIRRTLFLKNGILPIKGINMWEDMHITCRLSYLANRVSYINKAYYHYNQENIKSYSTNKISLKGCRNVMQVIDIVSEFYKRIDDNDMKNCVTQFQLIGTAMCLLKGETSFLKECPNWRHPIFKLKIQPSYFKLVLLLSKHRLHTLIRIMSSLINTMKYINRKLYINN